MIGIQAIEKHEKHIHQIIERKRNYIGENSLIFEESLSILGFFQQRCPFCYAHKIENDNHLLYYCSEPDSRLSRRLYQEYKGFFKKFRLISDLSACTFCFTPPDYCNRWEKQPDSPLWSLKRTGVCTYPDVILSVFVVALETNYGTNYTKDCIAKGITDKIKEIRYLGEIINWGDGIYIRLLKEFVQASKELVHFREDLDLN